MARVYSEGDITWSSVEKDVPYTKVNWSINPNGIPVYTFYDEYYNRIEIIIEND